MTGPETLPEPGDGVPPDASNTYVRIPRPLPRAGDARSMRSVRDLVRHATSCLNAASPSFGHGSDNAHDEAVAMVLWALHLPPETLEPYLDACATERERDTVARLLEARCLGCPLPYLTGEAWLGGLRFLCDPRALVPRSPIVEVLDGSLAEWMTISPPPDHWPRTIVDLCTGGGSLAIHAALRYPEACVHALDIDTRALSLCRENVALHGLEDRVVLGEGDLLAPLPPDLRIDLLVCNPPYVPAESMSRLPAEYRAEPGHALAGGDDGMDVIRRLLPQAAGRLTRHGVLVLEVGHEAETFERTFPMLEISWLETAAHDRMVALLTANGLRAAFQDAARA